MATVRVSHSIGDLARDLESKPVEMVRKGSQVVRKNIRAGRTAARANSKRTSGAHGKHHPKSITDEMLGALAGEWGPDVALPQGGMDFEFGSGRQTSPHLAVAKSADVVVPKFVADVGQMLDELFW